MTTNVQERCLWCHESAAGPLERLDSCDGGPVFVHAAHRAELEQYCRHVSTARGWFLGGIGASLLIGIVAQVLAVASWKPAAAVVAGAAAAVAGLTLLKFPFATPETVTLLGVRRSMRVVRTCGAVILVMAAGLALYGVAY